MTKDVEPVTTDVRVTEETAGRVTARQGPQDAAQTADAPVKVAILGMGGISSAHHLGFVSSGAEVVAICDIDEGALARRGAEWGVVRRYTDYLRMLEDGDFDVLSIAAPTFLHHPATVAAAEAGKHVLVEKPMALDLVLADDMIRACRQAGVLLQVNHQLRSSAGANKAKELMDAGAIGRLCFIRLRQAHDWGGRGVRPSFATKASSGGGTLLDNGCHLMDLAHYFGGRVREVYAQIATLAYEVEVEDTANVSLRFDGGALASVETAWTATGWEEGFWIYGTEGSLEFTNRTGAPMLRHSYRQSPDTTWDTTDLTTYAFAPAVGGAHTRHIAAFVQAVKGQRGVACTGQDGREAVRLVLAAYASAEAGAPVQVRDAPETLGEALRAPTPAG